MTTPIIIDKKELTNLRKYGEKNPLSLTEMLAIEEDERPFVGNRERHTCHLKFGFKVVFSIEEHPQRSGGNKWIRRMSMSLNRPGRAPSQDAVELVCQHLGFPALKECLVGFIKDHIPPYAEVMCEEKSAN